VKLLAEEDHMPAPSAPEKPAVTGQAIEHLDCRLDVTYNWGYEQTRRDLRDLYAKAQRSQWIAEETLPWDQPVDLEKNQIPDALFPLFGSDLYLRMTPAEVTATKIETVSWLNSQFLHGEQGALLAASQLVSSVPDTDSKFYVSTQVMDEARHVEVFDRYLHQKIGFSYPINPHLKTLLDLVLKDSRWDMKLLGMQIIVEGLALASFGMIRQTSEEPLLKRLVHYVMLDEARHVAYGVLALRDCYREASEAERREREDFVYESCVLMRDRLLFQEVWEKLGMPVEECMRVTLQSEPQKMFRQMLFAKIVPAVKRLGLLSERQRERFESLGILQFEDWQDPFDALGEPPPVPLAARSAAS
jgi:hypothetical protein